MLKRNTLLLSLAVLALFFVACSKKSAIQVETAPQTQQPVQVWEEPIDTTSFSEVDLDGELARKINENLQVLYFEFDSYELNSESLQKLQVAAEFLGVEQQLRIRLDGHADERGTTEYNMALGEKRAQAVQAVLVRLGVDNRRIETTSFGRERPANPNCSGNLESDPCHALNRRVEYTVIRR